MSLMSLTLCSCLQLPEDVTDIIVDKFLTIKISLIAFGEVFVQNDVSDILR